MTANPSTPASAAEHWQRVYGEKAPTGVSWYQAVPALSLELVEACRPGVVVDVGGGASTLVDHLTGRAGIQVIVVDIAGRALEHTRSRLGPAASGVQWIEADATGPLAGLPDASADVWHDRAVFHFLTTPEARLAYARNLARVLRPTGTAIIATFAPDGPEKCSGLPVCRHDGASIAAELSRAGRPFALVESRREDHLTPWGSVQRFVYAVVRTPAGTSGG